MTKFIHDDEPKFSHKDLGPASSVKDIIKYIRSCSSRRLQQRGLDIATSTEKSHLGARGGRQIGAWGTSWVLLVALSHTRSNLRGSSLAARGVGADG